MTNYVLHINIIKYQKYM